MATYVVIDDVEYSIDTQQEILVAQNAMLLQNIESLPVWVGDSSCGEAYKNGQTLFAE